MNRFVAVLMWAFLPMMSCQSIAAGKLDDKKNLMHMTVFAWQAMSLSATFQAMCADLRKDVQGQSDAEINMLTACMTWLETEKVTAAAGDGIESGEIDAHNFASKISPEILEQAVKDGLRNRQLGKAVMPNATAPSVESSSNITGKWCWQSPASAARKSDGTPFAYFQMQLRTVGAQDSVIRGNHCAVSEWGNRIDCADKGEDTIVGEMREGYFLVQFTSAYSGKQGRARIFATPSAIRWVPIPMSGVENYLPNQPTVLKRCEK